MARLQLVYKQNEKESVGSGGISFFTNVAATLRIGPLFFPLFERIGVVLEWIDFSFIIRREKEKGN